MTGDTPAPRRRRRLALLFAAVLAVVGVALVGFALLNQQSAPEPTAAAGVPVAPGIVGSFPASAKPVGELLPASPPASIAIPEIGVSSPVNPVGLNPDGTLEVPAPGPLYDQAAWYRASATPGELGPSIIIGHVDSAANGPSVFFDLARLTPGQNVTVKRADGVTTTFLIDSVRTFQKDSFPTQEVYATGNRSELRLITCGGPFDSAAGSYKDNTVVFAHLVDSSRS
ncbi:sortase (surface protein transpeptidase) [Pseudonocardia sediminis]|uniref:Sortase (Surface protein transpeptidase) n=1 Tax=Pseudonocardia sediminis TaxID=1397368 RepID=A0A4Q7UPL9_PSEST|nr:class F sortase [Pseudonocardia sediminis]RZT83545.1 sortase (surface protein transpeptidase) [Pseudonocardia sediminis]